MLYSVELRSHPVFGIAKIGISPYSANSFQRFLVTVAQAAIFVSMNIEIWSLGKENEKYIAEGMDNYFRKLKPWVSVALVTLQLPKKLATTDIERTKELEAELILRRLQSQHYLILLDERGKQLSSPQWAEHFQQLMNYGTRTLIILIGGAYGVSETVKQRANQTWSLSRLVFPHQLVRLIIAEQVYRAFSILNNSPYHHT